MFLCFKESLHLMKIILKKRNKCYILIFVTNCRSLSMMKSETQKSMFY